MSLQTIQHYAISAKKSLGQNFLVNEAILDTIASFFDISGKNILEVGPGYGALTQKLLQKKPQALSLIELDVTMIAILEDRILKQELDTKDIAFEIIHQDVLQYTPLFSQYSVIANIPYYITSPILRHFLYDVAYKPENMLILMQEDVGNKILDVKKSSVLSLFIAKKCHVREVIKVPRRSFVPAPKVESSVLYFELHGNYDEIEDAFFLEVIKKGFCANRKKLISNLSNGGFQKSTLQTIFQTLHIDENTRGEELNISQWCELIRALKKG